MCHCPNPNSDLVSEVIPFPPPLTQSNSSTGPEWNVEIKPSWSHISVTGSRECTQDCKGPCNMKCEASECESTCTGGGCNLECNNSDLCEQTCARGACEVKCTAKKCESSCTGGHCTSLTCTADNCTQFCGQNCNYMRCQSKQCHQSCTKGNCNMYCETGAEMCVMSCPGGNCKLHCDGQKCKRDCSGGGCSYPGSGEEVYSTSTPSLNTPNTPNKPKPTKAGAPRVVSLHFTLFLPAIVYLISCKLII